jgi:hypothetical protein
VCEEGDLAISGVWVVCIQRCDHRPPLGKDWASERIPYARYMVIRAGPLGRESQWRRHGIVVCFFHAAAISEGHSDSFCSFAQDAAPDPFRRNSVSSSNAHLYNAARKDVIARGETHIKSRDHNPD